MKELNPPFLRKHGCESNRRAKIIYLHVCACVMMVTPGMFGETKSDISNVGASAEAVTFIQFVQILFKKFFLKKSKNFEISRILNAC